MLDSPVRSRRVDLDALSPEDFQRIRTELNEKLAQIYAEACVEANRLLIPYGLKARILAEYEPLDTLKDPDNG